MLKVQPDPTFTAPVEIPTHLGPVTIQVEFKFRTEEEIEAWANAEVEYNPPRSNADVVMDAAAGWTGVDKPFTRESIEQVCKNYRHAATSILKTYFDQLRQEEHRLGN